MAASQGGNISSIGGYLGGTITTSSGTTSTNWNTAYTHSQQTHAPSNATNNSSDATLLNRANHTGTQSATTITSGVLDAARLPANLQNVASTSDNSGIYFRSSLEGISGEGWCTAHYAYNHNDGFLFLNRNTAAAAVPVFHIGGYNNAGYGGWATNDSIITLTRSDGTKTTGTSNAHKGLSSSSYYTNIVKTTTKTEFKDAQGLHYFNGNVDCSGTVEANKYTFDANASNPTTTGAAIYDQASVGLTISAHNLSIRSYDGSNMIESARFVHNKLTVVGDVIAYGTPSDKRLKENIKPIESALDKAMKLQGVTFDWKKSDSILDIKEDIGFIAQDVQKVLPELVRENEDGMLSMRHQGIAPILLEAIKELKAEIDLLKSKPCTCNKCNCNI